MQRALTPERTYAFTMGNVATIAEMTAAGKTLWKDRRQLSVFLKTNMAHWYASR